MKNIRIEYAALKYINGLVKIRSLKEGKKLKLKNNHFICCSCSKPKPNEVFTAGHFISQERSTILKFHPNNIHGECAECNSTNKDHLKFYSFYMEDLYGRDFVYELIKISQKDDLDYRQLVKPYLIIAIKEQWTLEQIFENIFKKLHAHIQVS